jgi:hypothetical protein
MGLPPGMRPVASTRLRRGWMGPRADGEPVGDLLDLVSHGLTRRGEPPAVDEAPLGEARLGGVPVVVAP